MRHFFLSLAAFALGAAGTTHSIVRWSDAARQDVEAGYRLFRENHPGWYDRSNPAFRTQLERARKLGLDAASLAHDERGYEDALGAFTTIVSDGHARLVGTDQDASAVTRWPGFIAAWRGQRLLIEEAVPTSPVPVGAEVVQCDEKPIRQFITSRLESRGMRPSEAGQWWSKSPRALIDSSDASGSPPSHCTFRTGSRTTRLKLNWSPAPSDLADKLKKASDGERTEIGLHEPRPGLFLIGLPNFDPDEVGRAAYRHLFTELRNNRARLQQAKAVVIDLRYNDGGSDEWGLQTAKALWGADAVEAERADAQKRVQIWWRASPGNTAYVEQLSSRLGRERQSSADQITRVTALMRTALHSRNPFAIEPSDTPVKTGHAAPDFSAPVYVITPGRCASACLDAVDTFKLFRNTHLIGAPTSADSQYIEIRTEPLPSGHGLAIIPTKMWVNRPRKGGEVYNPDVEATQLDWSTKAFLDLIQAQLTAAGELRTPIKRRRWS